MYAATRIVLIMLAAANGSLAWAQYSANVEQASRIAAARLESSKLGYRCSEFKSIQESSPELQQAVREAKSNGDHVLYCSPFLKPTKENEGSIGVRDGGVVVFVSKLGELRQPSWKY